MKKILVLVTVLALVAAMVVPMAVGAAASNTGSTTISGNIGALIEVTPSTPTASMGVLTVGSDNQNSNLFPVNVKCNQDGWTLVANGANNGGSDPNLAYMTYNSKALGAAFQIYGVSAYTNVPAVGQPGLTLVTGTTITATRDINIGCAQPVSFTDPATAVGGSYSIVITFTGTP